MLREEDIEWVKQNRALHERKPRKAMTNRERARYFRIRGRIKNTLDALTTLLENMPENQLEQTFGEKGVGNFLRSLLSIETKGLDKDILEKKRKRIVGLWDILIDNFVADLTYGHKLVGRKIMQALTTNIPKNIQAIYFATRFTE